MSSQSILAFLRVSSTQQNPENQRYEITSVLRQQGVDESQVEFVSTKGSSFKQVHQKITSRLQDLECGLEVKPTRIMFAAVDRLSRNYDSGLFWLGVIRQLGIPVTFARTPNMDIYTEEGWAEAVKLLQASELEAKNMSIRSQIGWKRRRESTDSGDGAPPAKRPPVAYPGEDSMSAWQYQTLDADSLNNYYRELLYLVYLLGHENAQVYLSLNQVKRLHRLYAPSLEEPVYGIRTGSKKWDPNEVFVGDNADFANILNVYRLGPQGPGQYDIWSADNIEILFQRILDPRVGSTGEVRRRRDFLVDVADVTSGMHLTSQ